MSEKRLKIKESIYYELKLIAAEANSPGIRPFLEDLFTQWVVKINQKETHPDIDLIDNSKSGEEKSVGCILNQDIYYQLNIAAALNKTSLANYMESIVAWLANEHKADGRVWIDDTPVRVLPIRTRK